MKTSAAHRKLAGDILHLASRDSLEKGQALRASEIARRLNVSRTPVHSALRHLERAGVVEHRKNAGYFLVLPALDAERRFDSAPRTPDAYLRFAADALSWGDGATVSVAQVMKDYAIARSEAEHLLAKAESHGWIERSPGHKWIVRLGISTEQDYARLYRFRRSVEPAALSEPGYTPDMAELKRLATIQTRLARGELDRLSAADLFEINRELHESVVAWSGNRFFLDGLRRSNDLRRLIEYTKVLQTQNIDGFAQEHLAILGAIERGELADARALLTRHLDGAMAAKT